MSLSTQDQVSNNSVNESNNNSVNSLNDEFNTLIDSIIISRTNKDNKVANIEDVNPYIVNNNTNSFITNLIEVDNAVNNIVNDIVYNNEYYNKMNESNVNNYNIDNNVNNNNANYNYVNNYNANYNYVNNNICCCCNQNNEKTIIEIIDIDNSISFYKFKKTFNDILYISFDKGDMLIKTKGLPEGCDIFDINEVVNNNVGSNNVNNVGNNVSNNINDIVDKRKLYFCSVYNPRDNDKSCWFSKDGINWYIPNFIFNKSVYKDINYSNPYIINGLCFIRSGFDDIYQHISVSKDYNNFNEIKDLPEGLYLKHIQYIDNKYIIIHETVNENDIITYSSNGKMANIENNISKQKYISYDGYNWRKA